MKVLLYLEGKSILEKSGIGRALHHQMRALDLAGFPIQQTSWVIMMLFISILMDHAVWCCCMQQNVVVRRSSCMVIRHVKTLKIHSLVLTSWRHFLGNIWPICIKRLITWLRHLSILKNWFNLMGWPHQSLLFQMGLIWKIRQGPTQGRSFPRLLWYRGRTTSGYLCGSLLPT